MRASPLGWLTVACAAAIGCGRIGFEAGDATAGPATAVAIDPPRFTTTSPTFVDIAGGTLTIPPSPGKTWLLLVSAGIQSSSFGEIAAEARYVIDGVERGIGGTQNNEIDRPGPWQHFYVLDGRETPIDVVFQLRDGAAGTATIERLHAVAMPLPASAEPLYASADPVEDVLNTSFMTHATFDLMPDQAATYLVMLLANAGEFPGSSNIATQWLDPAGQPWFRDFLMPRKPRQSTLTMRRITLAPGAATIRFQARTNDHAQAQYVRVLALRVDGFRSLDYLEDLSGPKITTSATPITVSTSTVNRPPGAYVALGTARVEAECSNTVPADRAIHFVIDGSDDTHRHVTANCAYETTYGTVKLLAAPPSSLRVQYASGNGQEVGYDESEVALFGLDGS